MNVWELKPCTNGDQNEENSRKDREKGGLAMWKSTLSSLGSEIGEGNHMKSQNGRVS